MEYAIKWKPTEGVIELVPSVNEYEILTQDEKQSL